MTVRKLHGLFEPVHEAFRIILPDNVAEEKPDDIESEAFRKRQFTVHHIRAEVFLAPDFHRSAAIGRHEYTSYRPRLGGIPFIGFLFTPPFRRRGTATCQQERKRNADPQ